MNDTTARKPWGAGRVAFLARLDTIKAEMSQGLPLTTIFERHQTTLAIGYPSFCKLVSRYAADAKLTARPVSRRDAEPVPAPPPKPTTAAPILRSRPLPTPAPTPAPAPLEGDAHARHEHPARPGFVHHGVTQEGEPDQLLGAGFLRKRRT